MRRISSGVEALAKDRTHNLNISNKETTMNILASFFSPPREVQEQMAPLVPRIMNEEKSTKLPTKKTLITVLAPKVKHRKKIALSPQRMAASKNLRTSIASVLKALFDRGISRKELCELNDHFAYHEYDHALTKATSYFRQYFPRDKELLEILCNAWAMQSSYYNVLMREADDSYWQRQSLQGYDSIEEAKYQLKLKHAIMRCQCIRQELCKWEVKLAVM